MSTKKLERLVDYSHQRLLDGMFKGQGVTAVACVRNNEVTITKLNEASMLRLPLVTLSLSPLRGERP